MPYGAIGEILLGEHFQLEDISIMRKRLVKYSFKFQKLGLAPPESRFYKTGDLVRYLDNANLQFIRRKDSQIKIRGRRVEIAEVEGTLKLCSDASDTAVEFLRLPNNKMSFSRSVASLTLLELIRNFRSS
jgi:acyl-coenzyme A synthetase/AMP-(fatty) acid ligase